MTPVDKAKIDAPTGPVSLREQQRAFTRERLLQGAADVFAEKGYIAATIDDIVASAGASRATFYLHFSTKRDLVVEAGRRLEPEVVAFYRDLDEVLDTGSRDRLREWMGRAVDWMEATHVAVAAADAAAAVDGAIYDNGTIHLVDHMPKYLAHWPPEKRHQAAIRISLLATQFRAAFSFLLATPEMRNDISDEELADVMTDIWLAGLEPPV